MISPCSMQIVKKIAWALYKGAAGENFLGLVCIQMIFYKGKSVVKAPQAKNFWGILLKILAKFGH